MTISKYLYLVVGAAAGSAVTFFVTKSYYQKKTEETINEVRGYYEDKKDSAEEPQQVKEDSETKEKIVYTEGYSSPEQVKSYQPEELVANIHEISEEEYGNEEGYEAIPTYIYYSDGVIVDEHGDQIDQLTIRQTIGADIHTREFDGGALYLRNEAIKCDFEIVYEDTEYVEPTIRG